MVCSWTRRRWRCWRPAALPCAFAPAQTAIWRGGVSRARNDGKRRLALSGHGRPYSNRDLDVRKEAVWLRETMDVPPEALVRMLTINGAAALNVLGCGAGRLEKGGPADFCVLPETLTY